MRSRCYYIIAKIKDFYFSESAKTRSFVLKNVPQLNNTASRFPVMIFFHGGGWLCGGGNSLWYGPDILLDRDVILVVTNYRLGEHISVISINLTSTSRSVGFSEHGGRRLSREQRHEGPEPRHEMGERQRSRFRGRSRKNNNFRRIRWGRQRAAPHDVSPEQRSHFRK
jgi:hypothetical protein